MKKPIECKLIDIKSVEDITFDDYLLYQEIVNALNVRPELKKDCLFDILLFPIPVVNIGAFMCFDDNIYELNSTWYRYKQGKLLKKTKNFERISKLMEEYTQTPKFKKENEIYETSKRIAALEDYIKSYKSEISRLKEEIDEYSNESAKLEDEVDNLKGKGEQLTIPELESIESKPNETKDEKIM